MTAATGWIALALLGGTPPEPDLISYEVRVLHVPAVPGRAAVDRHASPATRKGRTSVWTVDEPGVRGLLSSIQGHREGSIVSCPTGRARVGTTVSTAMKHPRHFVVDAERRADGPIERALSVAFIPKVEAIDQGVSLDLSGQPVEDGLRVRMELRSTWVSDVLAYTRTEPLAMGKGPGARAGIALEIPEVHETSVAGEFVLPQGRSLLVSMGTVTEHHSNAGPVQVERLALITPRKVVLEAEEVGLGRAVRDDAVGRTIATEQVVDGPRPVTPAPSRSLPAAIRPDGTAMPLPPLPDPELAPASLVGPPAPRPSPQSLVRVRPSTSADPSVAATRFEPIPGGSRIDLDGKALASGGTQSFRLPIGGRLSIELEARLVPSRPAD